MALCAYKWHAIDKSCYLVHQKANRRRSHCHGIPSINSTDSANIHHPHLVTIPSATKQHGNTGGDKKGSGEPTTISPQSSQYSEDEEEAALVLIPCLPAIRSVPPDIELARNEGWLGWVKFVFKWIFFLISFPFVVTFSWTIPNCSENRKWYVVTLSFLMSIVWIAIISFAMVTIVARVGCILHIDEFTMGLVVVAIGTSVPVSSNTTVMLIIMYYVPSAS